jgi:hypothetical protein
VPAARLIDTVPALDTRPRSLVLRFLLGACVWMPPPASCVVIFCLAASSRLAPQPSRRDALPDAASLLAHDPRSSLVHNSSARWSRGAAVRRVEVTPK